MSSAKAGYFITVREDETRALSVWFEADYLALSERTSAPDGISAGGDSGVIVRPHQLTVIERADAGVHIGPLIVDEVEEDGEILPVAAHKLGGAPWVGTAIPQMHIGIGRVRAAFPVFVLQISLRDPSDYDSDWPLGDAELLVFKSLDSSRYGGVLFR